VTVPRDRRFPVGLRRHGLPPFHRGADRPDETDELAGDGGDHVRRGFPPRQEAVIAMTQPLLRFPGDVDDRRRRPPALWGVKTKRPAQRWPRLLAVACSGRGRVSFTTGSARLSAEGAPPRHTSKPPRCPFSSEATGGAHSLF
jgi:hypothetical protein